MEVKKTTEYEIFKTVKGNRDINPKRVASLIRAVKKRNLLEHFPIVVNDSMKVIDGQHRLYVARELQVPIYYTVIDEGNLEDVQLINSNINPWDMETFLKSYISLGKEEYIRLRDFRDKYGLGLMTSIALLTNRLEKKADIEDIREDFTSGKFKITYMDQAEAFARILLQISSHVEGNFWKSREFMRALQIVFERITSEDLLKKFEETSVKLRMRVSVREYLRDLEEVYNFGQRKNYTRFLGTVEPKEQEVVTAE